jgi:MYXO-CTERM domain-containing protein
MRAVVVLTFVAMLPAGIVDAHIHLTTPRARTDSLTGDQKYRHCGVAGQTRIPSRVTTYRPGETITVTWLETVNHPGYYRIAFQPDGDTFGIPPPGNGPPAGYPSLDQTGMTDGTGALILKDFIPDGMLSAQITFPMMECNNCTLQFIQVMTDKPPYTIDMSNDIYFNCADITLSNDAPMVDVGGMPGPDAGIDPGNNPGGGSGCSTQGPTGLPLALVVLGLILGRRRRLPTGS